jgi:hypothetical protein
VQRFRGGGKVGQEEQEVEEETEGMRRKGRGKSV